MNHTYKPNFIVGGALKGGSTAIYHYLKQHPQIFMATPKELRFFAYDESDPWCLENGYAFPIKTYDKYLAAFSSVTNELAIGEASPNYLASLTAPQKLAAHLPSIKLIFSLRNPIRSAYSSYLMDVRENREIRPVEDAFAFDERRVERYRYYYYLKNWYAFFKPEQIKVILFEELIKEPVETVQSLYQFLGVDHSFLPSDKVDQNKGGLPKNKVAAISYRVIRELRSGKLVQTIRPYLPNSFRDVYRNVRDSNLEKAPQMPAYIERDLREYYKDDVAQLGALTGLNTSKWDIV